jgi:hypothetical protein
LIADDAVGPAADKTPRAAALELSENVKLGLTVADTPI